MSPEHQQAIGNINSFNKNNTFNNIVNFITEIDDEGRQILQWLSPLEPQQRHQDVRADRLGGVGHCVDPVLFCYGNPGVGKTYIR